MDLRRTFLLLTALRWLPTGLIIPVFTLLPLDRGLSVADLGPIIAAQGALVLLLELPTGGLTDSWGRRPVFVLSAVLALVAYLVTSVATTLIGFMLAQAISGVFRALDSGPLESWFVDRARRVGPTAVSEGLSRAGTVVGLSLACGSLVGGGLAWWAPLGREFALVLPFWLAAALALLQIGAALLLMTEDRAAGSRGSRTWRRTVTDGARLVASSRALRILFTAQLLFGTGLVALEVFMPLRLAEYVPRDVAGSVMGPVSAAAWGVGALGAAATPRLIARLGPARSAALLVGMQACAVSAMAFAPGPWWLTATYLLAYAVHLGFGASFNSALHERVTDDRRATVLSVMSLAFQTSGAVGGILLTLIGNRSTSLALLTGAAALLTTSAVLGLIGQDGRPQPD